MRPHPAIFSEVLILKGVKVPCFHTLLEVLILKELRMPTAARSTQAQAGNGTEIYQKYYSTAVKHEAALLLVGRGKLAELCDGGRDDVEGEGDVGGSGVAAEAEADGGASF